MTFDPRSAFITAALVAAIVSAARTHPQAVQRTPGSSKAAAVDDSQLPPSEKGSRSLAQQKIDSHILHEIYRAQGRAEEQRVPTGGTAVKVDDRGRALVDIRADVTPGLKSAIQATTGRVVSVSPRDRSTIAWVPLLELEGLAEDSGVSAIVPADTPTLR